MIFYSITLIQLRVNYIEIQHLRYYEIWIDSTFLKMEWKFGWPKRVTLLSPVITTNDAQSFGNGAHKRTVNGQNKYHFTPLWPTTLYSNRYQHHCADVAFRLEFGNGNVSAYNMIFVFGFHLSDEIHHPFKLLLIPGYPRK